jgi:aryl-alcohol dehydrogenase-like predicted oxidoreductase
METRIYGQTGVTVSKYCLGAMMFGPMGNTDHDECIGMVHTALDAGVNFIDTADAYSRGESEEVVGKALKGRRDDVVLATKAFIPMSDDPNHSGGSRRWLIRAVEDSLRRLDTDYIDLYQLHRRDTTLDLDESLSALDQLQRDGKIRYAGMSATPAEWIVEARHISDLRGHVRVRSEQVLYNIFSRGIERDVLPTCDRYGIGVMTYGPLNGGWLTGKYTRDQPAPEDSRAVRLGGAQGDRWNPERAANQTKLDLVDQLRELSDQAGLPMTHVAHAWAAEHPAVSSVIIGPRTPAQLDDALASADVQLDADLLDALDQMVPPGTNVDTVDTARPEPQLSRRVRRRSR